MKLDVYDELIDKNIVNKIDRNFNIEVNNEIVYNQKSSFTCWIFAGINMLKNELSTIFPFLIDMKK